MTGHSPLLSVAEFKPSAIQLLVLGTNNRKKANELQTLLAPLGLQLKTLSEIGNAIEVEESGETFIDNARLKASLQAVHLGEWTAGEDSGLCVPALGGAPGVYSARYSGPNASDESNNQLLLERMSHLSGDARAAYYVSTIVLADPRGQSHIQAEGRCWGRILTERRGHGGFGYDPLFEIVEYHQTFAELGSQVKSVLSHRARALEHFKRQLIELLPRGQTHFSAAKFIVRPTERDRKIVSDPVL